MPSNRWLKTIQKVATKDIASASYILMHIVCKVFADYRLSLWNLHVLTGAKVFFP